MLSTQLISQFAHRKLARNFSVLALTAAVLVPTATLQAAPAKKATAAPKGIVIEGDVKPFGNPNAPQGGTFNFNLGGEPTTLHPITGTDVYSSRIKLYVLDHLLSNNPDTYEWMPGLAEKLEISPDGKEFTFTLRKNAKFHDGTPLTAEDVKFSFDCIFDTKYNAAHLIPYYENIEKAEVLAPNVVKFTTKEKYFGNLDSLASLDVLPKHIYSDVEKSKKMNKTIIGSGPYKLEKYDQGQNIVLVRNKDWWGNSVSQFKGEFNFDRIRLRFVKEDNISIEMLKKGDLDFDSLTPEAYTQKATGPEWGKTVIKEKVENLAPKSYGYIGWNMRRNLFKERDVRMALWMLMNREEMNKKFRFDMSLPATGPFYQQSVYSDPGVKAFKFDPKKAVELLKKNGWADTDKDGILDKVVDGKKTDFQFNLNYASKDTEKYWVLYQNDLKNVGIKMDLQLLEWNSLLKNMDDNNFDAVALGWAGGNVDLDPKQIWHSSSAVKGGSNRGGYSNPEVDKLIDQARVELDKKKRIPILRAVFKDIANDAPYAFMFNDRFVLYAHAARMKMLKPTYKYEVGYDYWWIDPAAAK